LILICLLTAIGFSPGGSSTVQYSTVHIYTQTVEYSTHLHTNCRVQYTFTHKQYSTVHIYTQTVQYSTHLHTNSTVQYTFTYKQYSTVQYTFTYKQYSTVHIYTQTVHRTTQNKQYIEQNNNLGECGPSPFLAIYSLAFALQLRKNHGKTSVRVAASKNT